LLSPAVIPGISEATEIILPPEPVRPLPSAQKPCKTEFRDLYQPLDKAVTEAYGFYPGEDLLVQLLHLNLATAERKARGWM